MFQITNSGKMILTRGDTCEFTIDLCNEDGTPFVPGINDTVVFSIKKNLNDDDPLIEKTGLMVRIDSAETQDFQITTYYYDVKILFENGLVQTVIPKNQFEVIYNVGDWDAEN